MNHMCCGSFDINITLDGSLITAAPSGNEPVSDEKASRSLSARDADSLLLSIRSLIDDTWHRMQVLDLSPDSILSPADYREAILVDAIYINAALILVLADSVPYWVKTWLDDVDWDYIHELAECDPQDASNARTSTWHVVCDIIPQLDRDIDEWFRDPDDVLSQRKVLPESDSAATPAA